MKRLGVVLFFNDNGGDGMIFDLATGRNLFLHYSAIKSESSYKTVKKYDFIEFSIYRNLYSMQVDSCVVLEPDIDYLKVNTCLEMSFRRGVNILSSAPKYDISPRI